MYMGWIKDVRNSESLPQRKAFVTISTKTKKGNLHNNYVSPKYQIHRGTY